MQENDYYNVLGVARDADARQIKEAFRQKAFEFHPDRNPGNESAAIQMKAVNEAYAVLSNSQKRQEYDALRRNYGGAAYDRFRQTYSDQDIFKNSDLHQVFEEIARSFGLRGFEDIFKEFYGQQYKTFEFHKPGFFAKGFFFGGGGRFDNRHRSPSAGLLVNVAQKLIQNLTGMQLPKSGRDMQDVIELKPDFAALGGPYAYYHNQRQKKLVVKIPAGVRNGQFIRLSGMGQKGSGGGPDGDLYLKIRVRLPLLERIKSFIGYEK